MKTLALFLLLGFTWEARAGYKEAEGALKNMEIPQIALISKELDGLLAQPGAALARDARAAALLAENRPAMELFRQAAEEPNDGYLFAPKSEKLTFKTPLPKFAAHIRLVKLLLLEAKIKLAEKQPGPAEKNLLSVAGFLAQLTAQKSAITLSSMVEQLCLAQSYPALADSLRNPSVSPAYLKELAARLEISAKNQDFMRSAMLEEVERSKGSMREGVTFESMALERAKLGFLKGLGAKKLQDQEFFDKVYADYNAAVDAHSRVLIGAFRANDPAPVAVFLEKRRQEIQARRQAREGRGIVSGILDGLKGGPAAKKEMEELVVDTTLETGTPAYEKLIPRYHLFLCELNVLRSALALKLYQRGSRRLPDNLAQLVPSYLEAVPRDSFNKFAPLTYAKTGKKFVVYSFGPDGRNGGGVAALDYGAYFDDASRDAGDVVFAD